MLERFHRTFSSMLAEVISENQRDWCEHVPAVMAAYRASVHKATGYSPNMLMLGRENRLPVDLVLHRARSPEQEHAYSFVEYVDNLCSKMSKASALVRESMGVTASACKQRYDTRVKLRCFEPGQWVWHYYPRRRPQRSPSGKSFTQVRISLSR
jgi:hypothetical protein